MYVSPAMAPSNQILGLIVIAAYILIGIAIRYVKYLIRCMSTNNPACPSPDA